jgi:DME family drug/metabolite transporter
LHERVKALTWIALAAALAGMAIVLFGSSSSGSLIGSGLAIFSALCFSVFSILLRRGRGSDMTIALVWNALLLIVASAIVMLFPTGIRSGFGLAEFNIGLLNIGICLAMGAIQLTLGLVLYTFGSRAIPVAQLSLIALIEPTLAPLWVWLLNGESPPIWTFVGGAVILAAITLQAIYGRHDRPMPLAASRRFA